VFIVVSLGVGMLKQVFMTGRWESDGNDRGRWRVKCQLENCSALLGQLRPMTDEEYARRGADNRRFGWTVGGQGCPLLHADYGYRVDEAGWFSVVAQPIVGADGIPRARRGGRGRVNAKIELAERFGEDKGLDGLDETMIEHMDERGNVSLVYGRPATIPCIVVCPRCRRPNRVVIPDWAVIARMVSGRVFGVISENNAQELCRNIRDDALTIVLRANDPLVRDRA